MSSMNKSILLQQSFDTNQSKILNRHNIIDDRSSEPSEESVKNAIIDDWSESNVTNTTYS